MTTQTTEDLEARLVDLRQQHADLTSAIGAADDEMAAADEAVARAQAVFDVAAAGKAAPLAPNPYDSWTDPKPGEMEAIKERIQRGEGVFEAADQELGAALVKRNSIAGRRGVHLAIRHQVDEAIAKAEADLEHERTAPRRERDMLAEIKARIFGGAA
jgi:hypothetical protein